MVTGKTKGIRIMLLLTCFVLAVSCTLSETAAAGSLMDWLNTLASPAGQSASGEDAEIRAAMKKEGFGYGTKLACYDWTVEKYSYSGAAIPDRMRAASPDEIGGFIDYHPADLDASGTPKVTTLRFAFDPEIEYMIGDMGGSFSITTSSLNTLKNYDIPYTDTKPGGFWDKLWRFFEQARPILAYLTRLNSGHTPAPGGGNRMIARNLDSGSYYASYVPREMVARSDEELGYIMEFSISKVAVQGDYKKIGKVSGKADKMTYTILDAVSGEAVAGGTIGGEAPFVILGYNGNPDNGFDEVLSPDTVVRELLSRYLDMIGDGKISPDRKDFP